MQELRHITGEYNKEECLDYDPPATILAWTLIHCYRLVLRPSLLGSRWICGRFKAVTLGGLVECDPATIVDAPTAELAVYWSTLKTREVDERVE